MLRPYFKRIKIKTILIIFEAVNLPGQPCIRCPRCALVVADCHVVLRHRPGLTKTLADVRPRAYVTDDFDLLWPVERHVVTWVWWWCESYAMWM